MCSSFLFVCFRRLGRYWAEQDERSAADELADGGFRAEVTPAEDRGEEPQPPGMPVSKRGRDRDGLVI
jgi:hypothetical protein